MPDPNTPAAAAESLPLPQVVPLGGSKWARFFAGSTAVAVAAPDLIAVENAAISADGGITRAEDSLEVGEPDGDTPAFWLEAGERVSLGQFLTGACNIALQLPTLHRLTGDVLTTRQTDVLARLGRLRDYTPLTAPKAFRKVVFARFHHGAVAGPLVRFVADQLRADAEEPGAPVAVLPVRQFERFGLVNRASLTAWLRAKRFVIVEPERLKLAELIELFAAAPVVLLADPRQAGLLGLCHPGAKILEIAPEGWLGAAGHYLATLFGLAWHPFLACPPSYSLRGALPFGSLVPCSYEIPIRELAVALQTLLDS
jgi:hypothetical protein